jgi:hypothetical protein
VSALPSRIVDCPTHFRATTLENLLKVAIAPQERASGPTLLLSHSLHSTHDTLLWFLFQKQFRISKLSYCWYVGDVPGKRGSRSSSHHEAPTSRPLHESHSTTFDASCDHTDTTTINNKKNTKDIFLLFLFLFSSSLPFPSLLPRDFSLSFVSSLCSVVRPSLRAVPRLRRPLLSRASLCCRRRSPPKCRLSATS